VSYPSASAKSPPRTVAKVTSKQWSHSLSFCDF
jgi:hypothetical protein